MDGWNTILSYWVSAYFQGRKAVSFREGNSAFFNLEVGNVRYSTEIAGVPLMTHDLIYFVDFLLVSMLIFIPWIYIENIYIYPPRMLARHHQEPDSKKTSALTVYEAPCSLNTGMSCWYLVNGLLHPYISRLISSPKQVINQLTN